jgi:hypothetical protein
MYRLLALLAIAVSQAYSYGITFYNGQSCRSGSLGTFIGGPNQGCRKDNAGVAHSAIIQNTGPVDNPFMVTFFTSDDCKPDTEIVHGDSGCINIPNYRFLKSGMSIIK